MIIQNLHEYVTEYQPRLFTGSAELSLALDLIQKNRSLDLRAKEVKQAKLSLEVLIRALLLYSSQNHFLKFEPWDPTIAIKQFQDEFVVYQYNPFRDPANRHATGQKPAPAPTGAPAGARPDFLAWETFPENEHYLVWTASSGRHYGILVQPVPIVPDHLIIASLDLNPKTKSHYPQEMHYYLMADMHELQSELFALGYAMGFNDRGAGASVDHFHTQAVPELFLPLVRASQAGRLEITETYTDARGVSLRIVKTREMAPTAGFAYPVPAFILESDRMKTLLTKKLAVLKSIQARNLIFNSLAWQQHSGRYMEMYFPRGQESLMGNAFKAGYVEMSGMLVMPNKAMFESIQSPNQGPEALQAAGLSHSDFQNFLQDIYHYFH